MPSIAAVVLVGYGMLVNAIFRRLIRFGCPCGSDDAFHFLDATKPPVGASLLAMTSDQSTSLASDPPLSRAGSLPHFDRWCLPLP
ncbi:hypothetical protein C0J56_29685 [Pseudomonas fluorescens]|nr:hypothetical protein C0J56_29685 [Pseudomonas fluorescens]